MYTAIVRVEDHRIAKFAEFTEQQAAEAHCAQYGGFVYPGAYSADLWVEGETISVVPLPALTPPSRVTPWQFRKALNQQGLRQQVEEAVAASADQDLKDGWEFATEFVRNDPLVVAMAVAIGKTDAELDALFALAQAL